MNENLFEAQYTVTKKNKIKKFYDENKILIFSTILVVIISLGSVIFYNEAKEKKKTLLSDNYMEAKIYLANNDKNRAKDILKTIVYANDKTYSALSLFLLLDGNLLNESEEVMNLFNHVLENNSFEKEVKNLIIFKKALYHSNFANEESLLESVNPLLNNETLWKSHALMLMGDYYFAKKKYEEAKNFYIKIMSLKNLHSELYQHAESQLTFLSSEILK